MKRPWLDEMWPWCAMALSMVASAALTFTMNACDDDKPSEKGKSAQAVTPPTPEKIAGMSDGALKICATAKGGDMGAEIVVKLKKDETDDPEAQLHLARTDKGYCGFWNTNLNRLWRNGLRFTSDATLTELGVFYLKTWKETPAADDLTYVKAVELHDVWAINVSVVSQEIPWITVEAK